MSNKFTFNVPKDAYDLMMNIKEEFDKFHSKIRHRRGVHHVMSTHMDNYKAGLYGAYSNFWSLFDFFAVGSLKEKKLRKIFEDMQNTCSKYLTDNSYKHTISESVYNLISNYKRVFSDCATQSKNAFNFKISSNFSSLLNDLSTPANGILWDANNEVTSLTDFVFKSKSKLRVEFYPYIDNINKSKESVNNTTAHLTEIISSTDLAFLIKNKSKSNDLPGIIKKANKLISKCKIISEVLDGVYLGIISSAKNKNTENIGKVNIGTRLQLLIVSRKSYISDYTEFFKILNDGLPNHTKFNELLSKLVDNFKDLKSMIVKAVVENVVWKTINSATRGQKNNWQDMIDKNLNDEINNMTYVKNAIKNTDIVNKIKKTLLDLKDSKPKVKELALKRDLSIQDLNGLKIIEADLSRLESSICSLKCKVRNALADVKYKLSFRYKIEKGLEKIKKIAGTVSTVANAASATAGAVSKVATLGIL